MLRVSGYTPTLMQPSLDQVSDLAVLWELSRWTPSHTLWEALQKILPVLLLPWGETHHKDNVLVPCGPWERQNSAQQHSWEEDGGGGHTLGTQLTLGFLPGFSEASHQQHRAWTTAWISPHLSLLMPSIPLLWTISILHKTSNHQFFIKYIFKHSFKENSHSCKQQE